MPAFEDRICPDEPYRAPGVMRVQANAFHELIEGALDVEVVSGTWMFVLRACPPLLQRDAT